MSAAPDLAGDDRSIALAVGEARPGDVGRGIVRLDRADIAALGGAPGDVLAITGGRTTFARLLPAAAGDGAPGRIAADELTRTNMRAAAGETVRVTKVMAAAARRVSFAFDDVRLAPSPLLMRQIARALADRVLATGDEVRIRLVGGRELTATVRSTVPDGPVMMAADTAILFDRLASRAAPAGSAPAIRYEDLGGLSRELARVREMIEWPMKYRELFAHLGVEAPKGVLLSGPPGTGKTLLARAVAAECGAAFFQIAGPEIVSKHYGDSEEQLRTIFSRAAAKAPAVVFIDEIDAIAPKRDSLAGDRQLERRIVAQLLTLLDGLSSRGDVVVMAATNLPDSLDPALRRPGRFDREIVFSAPDRVGRREILNVHVRGMPLAPDVDLDRLAEATHGYVGADLAALAREAGMAALRRILRGTDRPGLPDLAAIEIRAVDFEAALVDVGPSALREIVSEVPPVRFADIGGAEEAKHLLTEAVIWPLTYPSLFSAAGLSRPGGYLLAGPPGTGKTLLAKALANEAGANFIAVSGPQLLGRYVGESERAVREVFARARGSAPTVLFFDEIDALAPRRGDGDSGVAERVVAQLLTEMDGIEERRGVFVLAATNRPDRIDPALLRPGRLDRVIEIGVPDRAARRAVLAVHAGRRGLDADVDLDALAEATEGFVGADLEAICRLATLSAVRRVVEAGAADGADLPPIGSRDFASALADVRAGRALSRPGSNLPETTP